MHTHTLFCIHLCTSSSSTYVYIHSIRRVTRRGGAMANTTGERLEEQLALPGLLRAQDDSTGSNPLVSDCIESIKAIYAVAAFNRQVLYSFHSSTPYTSQHLLTPAYTSLYTSHTPLHPSLTVAIREPCLPGVAEEGCGGGVGSIESKTWIVAISSMHACTQMSLKPTCCAGCVCSATTRGAKRRQTSSSRPRLCIISFIFF
jgi:hypothetical protein